jgi:hypothetical protein
VGAFSPCTDVLRIKAFLAPGRQGLLNLERSCYDGKRKAVRMKILGYEYTLVDDGDSASMGAFGRFHAKSQKLQIAQDLHEQQIVSTTLHEIIEALNCHLEWKLEHPVIMSMEAALYQTLCENGVDLRPIAKEILIKGK